MRTRKVEVLPSMDGRFHVFLLVIEGEIDETHHRYHNVTLSTVTDLLHQWFGNGLPESQYPTRWKVKSTPFRLKKKT